MADPRGRQQLHDFMSKEYTAENLDFWVAVQELKTEHITPQKVYEQHARNIYTKHVQLGCENAINLDGPAHLRLKTVFEDLAKPIEVGVYAEAEARIFDLIQKNPYSRFLQSDEIRTMLGEEQSAQMTARRTLLRRLSLSNKLPVG